MVPVASLLNPSPTSSERTEITESVPRTPSPFSSSPLPFKKQKMSKGAAKFVKGNPKGDVNYPPFEVQDRITAAEHEKYEVKPIGQISAYPKRIPYNSDKKSFQQKTGRDGFEGTQRLSHQRGNYQDAHIQKLVFQYTFRMPGDDRSKDAHSVMWDYNIGLVRVTALFKSLDYPKASELPISSSQRLHLLTIHLDHAGKSDER